MRNIHLILSLLCFVLFQGCVSQKKYVDLYLRSSSLEERLSAYKIPVQMISDTDPFDETRISINNSICDYEQLIRDSFSEYQLYFNDEKEIWFYDYLHRIRTNIFGDAYLLELYMVDYSDPASIRCSVKYFDSLEKKIGKLKETQESGNGINKLRNLIKNCDE